MTQLTMMEVNAILVHAGLAVHKTENNGVNSGRQPILVLTEQLNQLLARKAARND